MEPSTTTKKSSKMVLIVILAVVAVVSVGAAAYLLLSSGKDEGGQTIGYATEAKVMLDQDALQAAMDEAIANSRGPNVALQYKNNAYSDDGTHFTCYIVNSADNLYDMYLTIFADAELTDQIFLSGLVPPGSGFEEIELEHELETGDHRVFVVVTQVTTGEDGSQAIRRQVTHTMDFHVS